MEYIPAYFVGFKNRFWVIFNEPRTKGLSNFQFWQLSIWQFSILAILAIFNLGNFQFWQLSILAILAILAILTIYNFGNFQFRQLLAILKVGNFQFWQL